VGKGVHAGELLGIPATNKDVETDGIAIHRVRDARSSSTGRWWTSRASSSKSACSPDRTPEHTCCCRSNQQR
jgi:hypothetical protein